MPISVLNFNACEETYNYYIVHKQGVFIPHVVSGRGVMVSPMHFLAWHGFGFDLLSEGCT